MLMNGALRSPFIFTTMKVDIMLNERYYGTLNVKCLLLKSDLYAEDERVREEIESRLPLLKGKNYKLAF